MSTVFTRYNEIDKKKWDECIRQSPHGLLYAQTVYLDAMAQNWDGLVWGDYDAVMPLTWKQKWGIRYLYQPAFIQQAGVFGREPISEGLLRSFIEAAMAQFRFAEITLNYNNIDVKALAAVTLTWRTNYVLDLARPYDDLFQQYHPSFKKSWKRIQKFSLAYKLANDHGKIIRLYQNLYGKRLPYFEKESYTRFENLCGQLKKEQVIVRHAEKADGTLLAAVVLLKDEKRIYNLVSCITEEGKKLEANYFLYDAVVKEFAASPLLFDLEGSDIPGIAKFYEKFNAVNQPYPFIKFNRLPAILRLFKS